MWIDAPGSLTRLPGDVHGLKVELEGETRAKLANTSANATVIRTLA
jgi:hypothetical protein